MRKREHGLTLGEKIKVHLEKVKKKRVVSLLGDAFFAPVEEQGNVYFVRRTNLQRDKARSLNVVDEIQLEAE